jgi:hypothetical protein
MKVIRNAGDRFVLELAGREYRLLRDVLKLFPRIPVGYHQLNPTGDATQTAADQRLIEEALAAHKAESRRQLEAWLRETDRLRAKAGVWRLAFTVTELDWLLQVLNDVRVGSWLRLGSPADPHGLEVTKNNWDDLVALEFCGFLQSVLLRSLNEPT